MALTISNIKNKNQLSKYKNVAQISWGRLSKKETSDRESVIFRNIFNTELNRALINAYFTTSAAKIDVLDDERKKKAFYNWMFSIDDMDIKEINYKSIYVQTYKNTRSLAAFTKDFINPKNSL